MCFYCHTCISCFLFHFVCVRLLWFRFILLGFDPYFKNQPIKLKMQRTWGQVITIIKYRRSGKMSMWAPRGFTWPTLGEKSTSLNRANCVVAYGCQLHFPTYGQFAWGPLGECWLTHMGVTFFSTICIHVFSHTNGIQHLKGYFIICFCFCF